MSELDKTFKTLEWDRRLNKFKEEDESEYGKVALVFFLAGTIFGIILIQYILPVILEMI